eukprot:4931397-Prymnesium_polylepis.1
MEGRSGRWRRSGGRLRPAASSRPHLRRAMLFQQGGCQHARHADAARHHGLRSRQTCLGSSPAGAA